MDKITLREFMEIASFCEARTNKNGCGGYYICKNNKIVAIYHADTYEDMIADYGNEIVKSVDTMPQIAVDYAVGMHFYDVSLSVEIQLES